MLKRTLLMALAAVGTLAFAASAHAAYLSLATTNTSNAVTTLMGNPAGAELLVKNTNGASMAAFGLYGLLTATAPTANAAAVRGHNSSTNALGYGVSGSQAGSGAGVYGYTPSGRGVWGNTSSGTGVRGSSSSGVGVLGQHLATSGTVPGVSASTSSTAADADALVATVTPSSPGLNSKAVRGVNNGTGSEGIGVYGQQNGSGYGVYGYSPGGRAVYGRSTSGSGVFGESSSADGVIGESSSGSGVFASSASGRGVAGFSGSWQGIYGHSNSQAGVVGESGSFDGVWGQAHSSSKAGVSGHNDAGGFALWGGTTGAGTAIYGTSPAGFGVRADSSSSYGVFGTSADSYGVVGHSLNSYGVVGDSGSSDAGYFAGHVTITGGCSGCAGAALRIDHPLDPAHKYLQHSTVASSQQLDIYSGNATTNEKGFAIVTMPRWFQALNRSFRYQLTVVGRAHWDAKAAVWNEIRNDRFTIRTDEPQVKVSWLVTGIRHDRFANANRIKVVISKTKADQGKYLHPEVYGKPKSDGIDYRNLRKPTRLARHVLVKR